MRELTANMFNTTNVEVFREQENKMTRCKDLCEDTFTTSATSTEAVNVAQLNSQLRGRDDKAEVNQR